MSAAKERRKEGRRNRCCTIPPPPSFRPGQPHPRRERKKKGRRFLAIAFFHGSDSRESERTRSTNGRSVGRESLLRRDSGEEEREGKPRQGRRRGEKSRRRNGASRPESPLGKKGRTAHAPFFSATAALSCRPHPGGRSNGKWKGRSPLDDSDDDAPEL